MNRGVWQATVHGVAKVGHDIATNVPPNERHYASALKCKAKGNYSNYLENSCVTFFPLLKQMCP